MTKYNEQNERAKHEYTRILKHAKGKSQGMIDGVLMAIRRFEEATRYKGFDTFNREQVIAFKERLEREVNERTGKPLTKATILTIYNHLRAFFEWLAIHPDYRRKMDITAISYLNMTENDKRTAKAKKALRFPSMEQIRQVIFSMPVETELERRNRALVAFTILTGVRVNALVSLKLGHIDIASNYVSQNPNEVHTKFGKQIHTYFFPVGEDIRQVVVDWVQELQTQKLYGYNAPLFPRTKMGHDSNDGFTAVGVETEHWESTDPVRRIFREAFEAAGLPYYHPHSFRHTLGHLVYALNLNAEAIKAWSQNLGHERPDTTLTYYGTLSTHRQGELLKELANKPAKRDDEMMHYLKAIAAQVNAPLPE